METIGQRIRTCREDVGLTQEQMATLSGIEATQISHYECSRRLPSCTNLIVLCEFFGVSADYILDLSPYIVK